MKTGNRNNINRKFFKNDKWLKTENNTTTAEIEIILHYITLHYCV